MSTHRALTDEFLLGWVEYAQKQQPLLVQLTELMICGRSSVSDGTSSGNKQKSRPPYDMEVMDLHDRCVAALQTSDPSLVDLRSQARRMLGYDAPLMKLENVSCHKCGGQLVVAVDASTDVTCDTEGCGNAYNRLDWIEMLYVKQADDDSQEMESRLGNLG